MDCFTTIAEDKRRLRIAVRQQLDKLTPVQRQKSDRALFSHFLSLPQVQRAKTLFLFWGIQGREPETGWLVRALTAQGKRVGLPRVLPEHRMQVHLYDPQHPLTPAVYGILEPAAEAPLIGPGQIDLALVPALCYDRQGYRLGFGGGYYDRWLARFTGETVGLCRSCVLQNQVPTERHDRRVSCLLTEQGLVRI